MKARRDITTQPGDAMPRASRRRWWTLAAMSMALFMIMVDNTVVNLILASVQRSLNVGLNGLQWMASAYFLTFGLLLVSGGRLADIFGRRRVFVLGVLIFGGSSLGLGFASESAWLIALRAVQGSGAALMMPSMLSIITTTFESRERGKAIGIWSGVSALGLATGPLVGGVLTQTIGWRWVFFINVPVAVLAIATALITTRESSDEAAQRKLDVAGLVSLTGALAALLLAMTQGDQWGWDSMRTIGLICLSVILLLGFVAIELQTPIPMVDMSMFRSRVYIGACIAMFAVGFALFPTLFSLGLYLQQVGGFTPIEVGLLILPATFMMMLLSPVAGRLAGRFGSALLMATGLVMVAGSLLWTASTKLDTSHALAIAAALGCFGIGLGLAMPAANTAAMNAVDSAKSGVGAGVVAMSRLIGGTIGIAVIKLFYTGHEFIDATPAPSTLDRVWSGPTGAGALTHVVPSGEELPLGLRTIAASLLLVAMLAYWLVKQSHLRSTQPAASS